METFLGDIEYHSGAADEVGEGDDPLDMCDHDVSPIPSLGEDFG